MTNFSYEEERKRDGTWQFELLKDSADEIDVEFYSLREWQQHNFYDICL